MYIHIALVVRHVYKAFCSKKNNLSNNGKEQRTMAIRRPIFMLILLYKVFDK